MIPLPRADVYSASNFWTPFPGGWEQYLSQPPRFLQGLFAEVLPELSLWQEIAYRTALGVYGSASLSGLVPRVPRGQGKGFPTRLLGSF